MGGNGHNGASECWWLRIRAMGRTSGYGLHQKFLGGNGRSEE